VRRVEDKRICGSYASHHPLVESRWQPQRLAIASQSAVANVETAYHALSAGEGLGDATLLRTWRAGVFSVMRIYFSATLGYDSAMFRPDFTEVYYFLL
jgi:hypothetical protein